MTFKFNISDEINGNLFSLEEAEHTAYATRSAKISREHTAYARVALGRRRVMTINRKVFHHKYSKPHWVIN